MTNIQYITEVGKQVLAGQVSVSHYEIGSNSEKCKRKKRTIASDNFISLMRQPLFAFLTKVSYN